MHLNDFNEEFVVQVTRSKEDSVLIRLLFWLLDVRSCNFFRDFSEFEVMLRVFLLYQTLSELFEVWCSELGFTAVSTYKHLRSILSLEGFLLLISEVEHGVWP